MGRCDECGELVTVREWAHDADPRHPCYPCSISYGLRAIVNPENKPWVPGYEFYVDQDSGARRRKFKPGGHTRMTPRVYKVVFQIDQDGNLKHVGGPKPTDETVAALELQYQRERPGSNWYPGADDE